MNDKNEDTMQLLQQQLVSMSTIISKQDDQLTNERKGFATVVSKLNKHCKKLETELKEMKDNNQLQTSLDSKQYSKGSWEGSPRSTCCSSSTHSTADMTHASSLYYGDDCSSTLDGGDASVTKVSEESIEVWQERYDELVVEWRPVTYYSKYWKNSSLHYHIICLFPSAMTKDSYLCV